VIVMKNESGSAEHGCGSALLDPPLPDDPFAADEEAFWEQRGATLVPAAETGRMTVQRALGAEPGPVLAGCLAALDAAVLDGQTRVDLIRAWRGSRPGSTRGSRSPSPRWWPRPGTPG
jgi:hypothetical protein